MNYYEIYDVLTGELIANGNSKECCKTLGCSSMDTFYALVNRSSRGINKKYRVITRKGGASDYPVLGKYDPAYSPEKEPSFSDKEKLTPLQKALIERDEIDYCDECEFAVAVKNCGYCTISGKLLHPIMYDHSGIGTGPARNCQRRKDKLAEAREKKG